MSAPPPDRASGPPSGDAREPDAALPRAREARTSGALLAVRASEVGPVDASTLREAARRRARCERFERAVRAEVVGELEPAEVAPLREHLAACESCRAVRRESVATLARLGRGLRQARERAPRAAAPVARRRSVLVFVAAAAAFLVAVRGGAFDGADPRLWVSASGAGATVDGAPLVAEARVQARRGSVVAAGPDAGALLESSRARLRLAPGSRVLVEAALGPRVRLLEGRIEVEGRARLVTTHGVAELDAASAVVGDGVEGASLRVLAGSVRFTDGRGTVELPAGARLGLPRAP